MMRVEVLAAQVVYDLIEVGGGRMFSAGVICNYK